MEQGNKYLRDQKPLWCQRPGVTKILSSSHKIFLNAIEILFIHIGLICASNKNTWRENSTPAMGGSPGDVVKSLWRRRSERRVREWAVTYVKLRKDWRMSCDVGKATKGLENELWLRWSDGKFGDLSSAEYLYIYELCSLSKLPVASPTSQSILQPFRRFT